MGRGKLIKIGSYVLLAVGIIAALFLFILGIALFFSYPEASFQKKAGACVVFFIIAFIVIILTVAVYESMSALLSVEDEVEKLETELEHKND